MRFLGQITKFWTLKESYGKYHGFGMRYDFKNKDFSVLEEKDEWQDFEDIKVLSCSLSDFSIAACSLRPLELRRLEINTLCELAGRMCYERS